MYWLIYYFWDERKSLFFCFAACPLKELGIVFMFLTLIIADGLVSKCIDRQNTADLAASADSGLLEIL